MIGLGDVFFYSHRFSRFQKIKCISLPLPLKLEFSSNGGFLLQNQVHTSVDPKSFLCHIFWLGKNLTLIYHSLLLASTLLPRSLHWQDLSAPQREERLKRDGNKLWQLKCDVSWSQLLRRQKPLASSVICLVLYVRYTKRVKEGTERV